MAATISSVCFKPSSVKTAAARYEERRKVRGECKVCCDYQNGKASGREEEERKEVNKALPQNKRGRMKKEGTRKREKKPDRNRMAEKRRRRERRRRRRKAKYPSLVPESETVMPNSAKSGVS